MRSAPSSPPGWTLALLVGAVVVGAGLLGCTTPAGASNNQTDAGFPDAGGCLYTVTATPMTPRAGELLTLEVDMTSTCSPQPQGGYAWSIVAPDDTVVTPTLRQSDRIAEIYPDQPGTWVIQVTVTEIGGNERYVSRLVTVLDPQGLTQTYALRLTPPAGADVPRQQQLMNVTGGTPMAGWVVTLNEGIAVSNQLRSEGVSFGGYLRFAQSGYSLVRELHVPGSGDFELAMLGGALYDVTIIPDDGSPAPVRLENQTVPQLLDPQTFEVSPGETVVGYVEDAAGDGIGGARAVMRSGELPSSVGLSDAFDGRFILRARPGLQSVEIAPPAGSAWPRAHVLEDTGIELQAGHDLSLRLRYDAVPTTAATVVVRAGPSGQEVPLADARVTLEATGLGTVGTVAVTVDGSDVAQLPASGTFRVTAVTDAQGRLPTLTLPVGEYRVVIDAPVDAPAGYGTTVLPAVMVPAGPSADLHLTLAAPAQLEGWVVDDLGLPVEDVTVIAVTQVGVGSAVEVATDADGYFSLDVVHGATYSVLLVPPERAPPLARLALDGITMRDAVTTLSGGGPAGELELPRGLRITGRVVYQTDGLGGVLLQAIPSNVAGDPVLAEAVTDLAGEFELVIPDPGFME